MSSENTHDLEALFPFAAHGHMSDYCNVAVQHENLAFALLVALALHVSGGDNNANNNVNLTRPHSASVRLVGV